MLADLEDVAEERCQTPPSTPKGQGETVAEANSALRETAAFRTTMFSSQESADFHTEIFVIHGFVMRQEHLRFE